MFLGLLQPPLTVAFLNDQLPKTRAIGTNKLDAYSKCCLFTMIFPQLHLVGGFNPSEKYESQLG